MKNATVETYAMTGPDGKQEGYATSVFGDEFLELRLEIRQKRPEVGAEDCREHHVAFLTQWFEDQLRKWSRAERSLQ